tara:strand:- start:16152 stop:16652 length:501 start_codon:yes stop_codon:yes gene_type:complete
MSNNNIANGRVNILGPNISTKFSMMDKIPVTTNTDYGNVLTGTFERTPLSDAYFSIANITIIQNAMRKGVYDKSGGKIMVDNQPQDQIVSVMRSFFFQHSKNLPTNVSKQITDLNSFVIKFCINSVFSEAVAYLKYKEDSSKMHVPMAAPIYANKAEKSLELKPWF